MKKNISFIILAIFIFSQYIFPEQKIKINIDYKNMRINPMGMEKYTFKSSQEIHYLQEGGDYSLSKGNYKLGKDKYGEFIVFTYKYYNYGFEKDKVHENPVDNKYYFISKKNIFLIYDNDNKEFYGYSSNESVFLSGNYSATSTYVEFKDKPDLYNPKKISDEYNLKEFWVEGIKGYGLGEKIMINFTIPPFNTDKPEPTKVDLEGIIIFNGVYKSIDLFNKNSRVKNITLTFSNGKTKKISLEDTYHPQIFYFNNIEKNISNAELKIDSIYKGSKWEDTCLTKVIYFGKYIENNN